MFETVQKHKRLMQLVLVLLILPPFAFFGLESYTRSMRSRDEVARVDGVGISQREFEEARRAQIERLRKLFGTQVDLDTLDTPRMREAVLDRLVTRDLATAAAIRGQIAVNDAALRATIRQNAAFERDGRFDAATYRAVLAAQGMTEAQFEAQLRQDLAVERLTGAIAGTAIVSRAVTARQAALEGERREVAEAQIAAEPFLAQVKLDEAQLKAYYEANRDRFRVPERVRADYVVLAAEALGREGAVTEDELKAAYAARASQYRVPEERRASHILVKTRAEAEKLLAELRQSPDRFAELAKKYSQDAGSAAQGGDLGFFARGSMVKPFEDAVFGMKEGEIAGPVKSEFGFHVIRLTGIQPGHSRSLEDVRRELAADLERQKGGKRFAEAAETFSQMVYEQSDSLAPVAERFRLPIQHSPWITRRAKDAPAPLNHAKLLDALFSQDAIGAHRNTDAVEVAPNTLVAARVAAHEAERQRPFGEVRAEVETLVRRQEAAKLAWKEGAAKLARLGENADAGLRWSAPQVVSVQGDARMSPAARRKIFAADPAKLPGYVGDERGDQGYVIYRVQRVVPTPPRSPAQQAADLAAAERRAGSDQLDTWLASRRAHAKIEVNRAALERK
jgi:peptidyl-prolyl cis-trans isomerase D